MNTPEQLLSAHVAVAVKELFGASVEASGVTFQKTNPQFEGDITLVVFPFTKLAGKSPEQTAQIIGEYLQNTVKEIASFNVVKGFLNLVISSDYWLNAFSELRINEKWGEKPVSEASPFVMVEYSSPNTNKPLHLGHMRNILLGHSVSEILNAAGNKVMKVNLVNDRGIHICKSMLAWEKFGNGETPESSGMKGDKLVGKYYVEFDKHYKAQIKELEEKGISKEDAEKRAPLMLEAQEMLRKWEANDPHVRALWEKMNGWVYDGFAVTYKSLGVTFDKTYYESQTYVLGKSIVEEGLKSGVLVKRPDGAVIIDNTDSGLDQKVLLRSDGTSVYMTQDLGTAVERHKEYPFDKHIYVVGNEQDYHFKTLIVSLRKLGYKWADGLYHLSYGMVELPEGKMKSREGTVVDADDLVDAMRSNAFEMAQEKGLIAEMSEAEQQELAHNVGMAALKYFILKVDPKKKMLFNPKESIDLQGNTGPFIQYTHARIRSIWRKSELKSLPEYSVPASIHPKEKELIKLMAAYPQVIQDAAKEYSPAVIANYTYELAKTFNQFYDACDVLKEQDVNLKNFRINLCVMIARTIKHAMGLIGVVVPEKM
ncbi:MAG: arginine--tRNA ligase [Bacteroidia bacterium]|nr:arginine--tRNA ligase [Bacteroidia bacterium]